MDKLQIIDVVKRIYATNGGETPSGKELERAGIPTGIWTQHWNRLADLTNEAGLEPNTLQQKFTDDYVLEKYCELVDAIGGRIPVHRDVQRRKKVDKSFPNHQVFREHFGGKDQLVASAAQHCRDKPQFQTVLQVLEDYLATKNRISDPRQEISPSLVGYVYLIKWRRAKYFKVGKTVRPEKRPREIGLKVPDMEDVIHWIPTDDPSGVEAYWKNRFRSKLIEGTEEFYRLAPQDVAAFKAWKKIL